MRGATLLEVLISTAVLLVILGAAGSLIRSYSRTLQSSRARQEVLQAAQALESIRQESEGALSIEQVGAGRLAFSKRLTAGWLPVQPGPVGSGWNPLEPARLARVTYRLEASQLVREDVYGGESDRQVVAHNLRSFGVRRPAPDQLELSLEVLCEQRVIPLQSHSLLRSIQ